MSLLDDLRQALLRETLAAAALGRLIHRDGSVWITTAPDADHVTGPARQLADAGVIGWITLRPVGDFRHALYDWATEALRDLGGREPDLTAEAGDDVAASVDVHHPGGLTAFVESWWQR